MPGLLAAVGVALLPVRIRPAAGPGLEASHVDDCTHDGHHDEAGHDGHDDDLDRGLLLRSLGAFHGCNRSLFKSNAAQNAINGLV